MYCFNSRSTVTDQVIDINTEMINKLYVILKETFEDECVVEHIEKLTDHVKTFYDEVISEISTRHYQIKDEIAGKRRGLFSILHLFT